METADLGFAQAQDVEQYLVGVFAQGRRRHCRETWRATEVERCPGHQVRSDARLLGHREQRIIDRAIEVAGKSLTHTAIRTPSDAVGIEDGCGFGKRARVEPRFHQRGNLLPGAEAVALIAEVEA